MFRGDLPTCAICRTRVARVEVAPNIGGGHTLIAYCHGERDVVDISAAELVAMVQGSLRLGVAFQLHRRGCSRHHDGARLECGACSALAQGLDARDSSFAPPRHFRDGGPYVPIQDGRPRAHDEPTPEQLAQLHDIAVLLGG